MDLELDVDAERSSDRGRRRVYVGVTVDLVVDRFPGARDPRLEQQRGDRRLDVECSGFVGGCTGRRPVDLELDVDGAERAAASFSMSQACACSWVWNWAWTGGPSTDASAPASPAAAPADSPAAAAPQVAQSNVLSTSATAAASSATSQTVSLAIGAGSLASPVITFPAAIAQQISASQLARAVSQGFQTAPSNLSVVSSGVLSGLSQSNSGSASSTASTDFRAAQTVSVGADEALPTHASSAQSIANAQSVTADAQTVQTGVFNVSHISSYAPSPATIGMIGQSNSAASFAFGVTVDRVFQIVSQFQGGTGPQSDTAAQTATVSQVSNASAQTSQTHVGNVDEMVIPAFGMWNPSLSQSNSVDSYAEASSSSVTSQTVNQAVTNTSDSVSFDLQAEQDGSVTQSGTASSTQAQANRVNRAGWGGIAAAPQASAPAPAETAQAQTVVTTQTAIESPPTLMPFALPPALPAALPRVFPSLPPSRQLATPGVPRKNSSELRLRSQTGAFEAAEASGLSNSPEGPAPVCEHSCGIDLLLGAIGGARATGSGSGDPVAALSRLCTFAPPGAGRVQLEEPAPGAPAFTSPIERPG